MVLETQVGRVLDVGRTQFGERSLFGIDGGEMRGEAIAGTVREGGLDFHLVLDNGVVESEQVLILQADNGEALYMRSCGVAPSTDDSVRFVPDIEALQGGAYDWLNTATLVGVRDFDPVARTVTFRIYDVSAEAGDAAQATPAVVIERPEGSPGQLWACATHSATAGDLVLSETVTLAETVTVGESKRGMRAIIPITGGTVTGEVEGVVVPGGGDFQIIGTTYNLDARYTLETNDGEFILVRNCGEVTGLVPTFEARAAGPYNWLNEGLWSSAFPFPLIGAVMISIYEAQ